jgi:hypothetical protein
MCKSAPKYRPPPPPPPPPEPPAPMKSPEALAPTSEDQAVGPDGKPKKGRNSLVIALGGSTASSGLNIPV